MIPVILISAILASVLAWIITGRHKEHRPIAVLLSIGFLGQGFMLTWGHFVIAPLRGSLGLTQPWEGWPRAAAILYESVWHTWPCALIGACLVVLFQRSVWPVVLAWVGLSILTALNHPVPYLVVQAGSLLIAAVLLTVWYRRSTGFQGTTPLALGIIILGSLVSPIRPTPACEGLATLVMLAMLITLFALHLFRKESQATRDDLAVVKFELRHARDDINDGSESQMDETRKGVERLECAIRDTSHWEQKALKGAAKHIEEHVDGSIRDNGILLDVELERQRGAIKAAAECSANTARTVAVALALEANQRDQDDQAALDAALDIARDTWDSSPAREQDTDPDPTPWGLHKRGA